MKYFILFLFISGINSAFAKGNDIPSEASLFGKYSGLKKVVVCTKSNTSLHTDLYRFNYYDLGMLKKGKSCGKEKGPGGFYIFFNGKYYVWKKLNKNTDTRNAASLNGKYSKLLMKIKRPGDRRMYKYFVEQGYRPYGLRLGRWAPEGYYVYLYPNWYIWKNIKKPEKIPEGAKHNIDYVYHYSKLIQHFRCTKDKKRYGKNYESGRRDTAVSNPYCGIYSKPGYWVYSYPNWYIWEKREKVKDYRDINPDAEWPPR